MGSGVSVHKNPDPAMKLRHSKSSKARKILNGEDPCTQLGFKSQSSVTPPLTNFREIGSKEETFFDSQAWLESDCEDDFVSVNGDFTPRTSTSNHVENYQFMDKAPDYNSEPSPTDTKKKLSELLLESNGVDEVYDDQNKSDGGLESKQDNPLRPSKPTNGFSNLFPYLSRSNSVRSSGRTPNGYSNSEKEKSAKAAQCCLPILVPSFSFRERKKGMSPDDRGGR